MIGSNRLIGTVFLLWLVGACRPTPPPSTLGQAPSFQMTAVSTESTFSVSEESLRGSPWVANFIFTNCAGPCPLLSTKMAWLQKKLPSHVRLISFTVDPEQDTPPVLQNYAKTFKANPARWWFLRGTPESVQAIAVKGFGLGVVKNEKAPSGLRFTHSTKFVLVDSAGRLRGYYESTDHGLDISLRRDIRALDKEDGR